MTPPRTSDFDHPKTSKRQRNLLSFKTKMEIIRRLSTGETTASLSRVFKVNESSIRTISKNAEKIKTSVANASPLVAGITWRTRNPILMKTETILTEWIESQESEVNYPKVRAKALAIYEDLCKKSNLENNEAFAASKGWYHNFTKRLQRQHINTNEIIDSDSATNSIYWEELKNTIITGSYEPQQIFNGRQTNLFWKRLPTKVYHSKKSVDERLKIFLCNNIDGSFKCKPFIVHKSSYTFTSTTTFCKRNKNGQMTDKMFENWYLESFCKELECFCLESDIEFKALLLLDNLPGYPLYLPNLHPNIKVLFLPMDITIGTHAIQQNIITIFKLNYIKRLFTQMLDPLGDLRDQTIDNILTNFTISEGTECIHESWRETDIRSMNTIWEKLCKKGICHLNFQECLDLSSTISEITSLGISIGGEDFENMVEGDIIELLEPNEEDIAEVRVEDEAEEKCEKISVIRKDDDGLDDDSLTKFFYLAERITSLVTCLDPNIDRSSNFVKELRAATSVYRINVKMT